jgi:DNA-binding ferritin-like protein
VQITYVGLAVLMGGGLVLSGIGSSATGGLLDALVGNGNGGGNTDIEKQYEKQITAADKRVAANPKDAAALSELVRAHFNLAQQKVDQTTGALTNDAKAQLQEADDAWTSYLALDPARIDPDLAAVALQMYEPGALGNPTKGVKPAQVIAADQNTSDAYIKLVEVATRAGDTRTADLAEKKALSLAATKDDKASVKEQIAQKKAQVAADQAQQSQGAQGVSPTPGGG